jgi:hypothetical protein
MRARAEAGMRPRTRELLEQADEWLDYARLMVSAGGGASAISGVGPPPATDARDPTAATSGSSRGL